VVQSDPARVVSPEELEYVDEDLLADAHPLAGLGDREHPGAEARNRGLVEHGAPLGGIHAVQPGVLVNVVVQAVHVAGQQVV